MTDLDRNVRVSFKLSREAAIKLREVALTKSDVLCNLGVLAVQLGNESQICISNSSLNFDDRPSTTSQNRETRKPIEGNTVRRQAIESKNSRSTKKNTKDGGVKKLSNVDRRMRAVDAAVARAALRISDSLPSMNTLHKAPLMHKATTETNRFGQKVHVKSRASRSSTSKRTLCQIEKRDNVEMPMKVMKQLSRHGVKAYNAKEPVRLWDDKNALCVSKPESKKPRERIASIEINEDTIMTKVKDNMSSDSVNANDVTAGQEIKIPKKTPSQDSNKVAQNVDNQNDKVEIKLDGSAIKLNMTDTFDCNVNSDINSNVPTFPGHGISFAQHLINLSKQYRLENEKSPLGLSNESSEKFFASEASRIVRNDHVLRSFTTSNEKQEDFMGFSGNSALLFDASYSTTAVKSAEELSKEQSEASPTNLDSMSEASADSLFEDARLGSVDELSMSPSSNENTTISSESNSRTTSPTENTNDSKHEKLKRKMKYPRHYKGHTGIVCKLCMHPVSKSYSCYKLANAPKEIRHLFDDGSHCVRVCRRCLPYKSPKSTEKNTQKKLHKTITQLLH